MKAIVYSEPKHYSFTEVPKPVLRPDDVLIKVKACGICGTDLHIHNGEFIASFPLIPGHEIAGEIAEVGSNVKNLEVGTRVVADNTELCGCCYYCRRDQPLYCENFISHGCNIAGGFADFVALPAAKVFPIHNLSWSEAVMVEPTACAVHGMDVIALKPGSSVLLFGAGPTSLILAQLLKRNGAVNLTVVAPSGPKLELMSKLAADNVITIDRDEHTELASVIHKANPHGFDCVIEATGVPEICQEAINYVAMGGQLIVYGVYPEEATITWNPYTIFKREITIKGSFAQTHCFDRAIQYLENGLVQVKDIVTQTFTLEAFDQALANVRNKVGIKTAILNDSD